MKEPNKTFESLSRILPRVEKAARYTGGEVNMARKDPASVDLRVVLIYPDIYEIGMSNLGLRILYDILNRRPDVYAERAFHPWVDMEDHMRGTGLPLSSLETFTPLKEFDLIGFSLGTELVYTNVLNLLDLAGIPLRSGDRKETDPLVSAGGICAYNPEPMADFFDFFLIGDGEEAVAEISDRLIALRGEKRDVKLRALAEVPGVYVPAFYEPVYSDDGSFRRLTVPSPGVPEKIERRILPGLGGDFQVQKPLVSLLEITHDRLAIEIMRGCTRGCRFCMAGTVYRPVRELAPTEAARAVDSGLARTGWEEVSLVSLSSSDYSGMMPLLDSLKTVVEPGRVAVSLPSQRPDAFTGELAEALSLVKKTGLTFAVEAGSHRLRRVINKDIADDDILRTAAEVIEQGWRLIKFYFMIGLPTETDEDIDGIERLARDVFHLGRKSHRRFALNLNVSPFVPKPHTPFQWVAQEGVESLNEKGRRVKERLREGSIRVKLSDPQSSLIEGVLARGDRRLGAVVEDVWKNGGKLEGWSRFFRYDLWREAFDRTGLDPDSFTGELSETAPLPWGHIDTGVGLDFLRREWSRARQEKLTPDCRVGPCQVCGLFPFPVEGHKKMVRPVECSPREAGRPVESRDQHGRRPKRSPRQSPVVAAFLFRFKYAKLSRARFLGHLDTIRALTRALRTIGAPLAYSQGYSPHPKIAFGPPLPLGIESESEYFDVQFHRTLTFPPVRELNRVLPEGLRIIDGRRISKPRRSLTASIEFAAYRVEWPNGGSKEPDSQDVGRLIAGFMAREKAPLTRPPQKEDGRSVTLDLRPLVLSADLLHSEPAAIRFVLAAAPAKTARPLEVLQLVLGGPVEPESLRLVREEVFRLKPDGDRLTPVDPEF